MPTPTFVSATGNTDVFDTGITINEPANSASGHSMIAVLFSDGTDGWYVPDGWTLESSGLSFYEGVCFSRPVNGGAADYTFTYGGEYTLTGFIITYSGVDTDNICDAVTVNTDNITCPTAEAFTDNTVILRALWGDSAGGETVTAPTGHTERIEEENSTSFIGAIADISQPSSGAVGTATFSFSTNPSYTASFTIPLRAGSDPAPAPSPTGNGMTDYLESGVINAILRGNPDSFSFPTGIWIGLTTDTPSDASPAANELSGNGYARTKVLQATGNWTGDDSGLTSNLIPIEFPAATADWLTASGVIVTDAASGGNVLFSTVMTTPVIVSSGNIGRFASGSFDIELY